MEVVEALAKGQSFAACWWCCLLFQPAVPKNRRPLVVSSNSHASSLAQLGVTIMKPNNEGS